MADQGDGSERGSGYKRNWVKYAVIYLLVGGAVYALIYFLGDGYGS